MRYVIAVGANMGDASARVEQTLDVLAQRLDGELLGRSSLYRTAPVGGVEQSDFINAVAIVETSLDPRAVLDRLQALELEAGRERIVRWGPRTLDLDVIAAGDLVSDDPELTLPHPRTHERAFVLIPWLEIDPSASIPGVGSVRDLVTAGVEDQRINKMESA
ncbi:MAG: 2-amino-4-hydroxy-6-hydroxymethyldihydropteridine diphosphokinase [Candidatus Nanopelagicales bacterium]